MAKGWKEMINNKMIEIGNIVDSDNCRAFEGYMWPISNQVD